MKDLPGIILAADNAISAAVETFTGEVEKIVAQSTLDLQERLRKALVLNADGTVKRTRANSATLAKIDDWFMEEMAANGFTTLARSFVNSFPGQLVYFDDVLSVLAKQAGKKIDFSWSTHDKRTFTDFAAHSNTALVDVVEHVAKTARAQILLSFGAVSYSQLVKTLEAKLAVSTERAASFADTAMMSFWRTVANQGFRKLEFYFPGKLFYQYFGPPSTDRVIRPFCRKLMAGTEAGTRWTREEIDQMDNGSSLGTPVFKVGGGFRCRHAWMAVLHSINSSVS